MSSGGVFEVEWGDQLIYSKKRTGRFPEQGEVLKVVFGLEQGLSLTEAQQEAARNITPPASFLDWLNSKFVRRQS